MHLHEIMPLEMPKAIRPTINEIQDDIVAAADTDVEALTDTELRSAYLLLAGENESLQAEVDRLRTFVDTEFDRLYNSVSTQTVTPQNVQKFVGMFDTTYFVRSVFTRDQLKQLCILLVTRCSGVGVGETLELWQAIADSDPYMSSKMNK